MLKLRLSGVPTVTEKAQVILPLMLVGECNADILIPERTGVGTLLKAQPPLKHISFFVCCCRSAYYRQTSSFPSVQTSTVVRLFFVNIFSELEGVRVYLDSKRVIQYVLSLGAAVTVCLSGVGKSVQENLYFHEQSVSPLPTEVVSILLLHLGLFFPTVQRNAADL